MTSFEKICGIVSNVTGIPEKSLESNPDTMQMKMDSLDMAEVILDVEEEFDMIVENEADIKNVGDLVHCVDAL